MKLKRKGVSTGHGTGKYKRRGMQAGIEVMENFPRLRLFPRQPRGPKTFPKGHNKGMGAFRRKAVD